MKPRFRLFMPISGTTMTAVVMMSLAGAFNAGADTTWTGATSQDWADASNWDNGLPGPGNGWISIQTFTGNTPILSTDATAGWDVFIGTNGGSGRLDHTSGVLSSGAGNWAFIGTGASSQGTYNLTGDAGFTAGRIIVGQGGGVGGMTINTSGTVTANAPSGNWWEANAMVIGNDAANSGTVNLQSGNLVTTGDIWVGSWGGGGLLNQTGGSIGTTGIRLGQFLGSGTVSVANGELATGYVVLSAAGSAGDLSNGTMNVYGGGTVNSEGDLTVGLAGNGLSQALLNIDGGTVNVGSNNERWMIMGQWDSVNSTLDVKHGGTLKLNSNTDIRMGVDNNNGTRVINVDGGSIIGYADNGSSTVDGGSVIEMGRGNGTGSDTLNIRGGGSVEVRSIYTNASTASAVINFDTGTLRATGNDTNLIHLAGTGVREVNVLAGGATIDSNGYDVTIHNALLDGGGNGGLTKEGEGTLTLLGASTYTGATTVSAGTLFIAGSLGNTAVTVQSGAVIAGDGLISGSLHFGEGSLLDVTGGVLTISGAVSFDGFGFANLFGFDVNTAEAGVYTFLEGTDFDFANVEHHGVENALDLGGGKSAYFQNGSLQVVVIPEPGSALLAGIGTLLLMRRRRN